MKIAYLFGSLNRGGTETLMLDVCKNLSKDDFDAIAIYRKPGVFEADFQKSNVPFYKLSPGKNILSYLIKLRKLIKSQHIDIVHAQQPLDALYASFALLGTRIKIVHTWHGFDFSANTRFIKFIIGRMDKNFFVSHYQKEYYTKKYKLNSRKSCVIYNGVNFTKILNKQEHSLDTLREELNIPKQSSLMGMVGNFNAVRDQITICRFLNLLKQKQIDFHFLFIGKRIENEAWRYDECVAYCKEQQLDQQVQFLGSRDDVPAILSQLDAFIYSTAHDTFGIAPVEAIATGVPVFLNDWPVMEEISNQGELAILYKTKDENDLLQKFMLFLHNKEVYDKQALIHATKIREKFSIGNHIRHSKLVYKELLQQ